MTEEEEEFYSLREIIMNHPFDEKFSSKRGLGYVCLPTLLALFFYWEGLGAYFSNHDLSEIRYAVDNAHRWYLHTEYWRPVWSGLSHLTYLSFGLDPLPYRLISLILYVCILTLLYHLYNLFFENKALSKVALLLFASFYFNTESVGMIVCQRDLLLILFVLTTLVCFIYYKKTQSPKYYTVALSSTLLACLSKETGITLPLFLLAVDYHISYGIFPPNLSLKNIRQNLLIHLPFWFVVLAFYILAFILLQFLPLQIMPGNITPGYVVPISKSLENVYWFSIYALSPCFITDRLTIVLAFCIVLGIGWLFYRSSFQRRALLIAIVACMGLSLLPYTTSGVIPRYFLLLSAFSMLLVTLLAFEIGGYVQRFLEERLQLHLSPGSTVILVALLILLPAIYLNYQFVRQYTKNSVYAGRLFREVVEGTAKILPQGPGESQVIYVNLPGMVLSKSPHSTVVVGYAHNYQDAVDLHYRQYGVRLPSDKVRGTKAILVDLGYPFNNIRLTPKAWYNLLTQGWVTKVSAQEYNNLSKDGKNKLLFFNSVANKLEDVSGLSYEKLVENLSPYMNKIN